MAGHVLRSAYVLELSSPQATAATDVFVARTPAALCRWLTQGLAGQSLRAQRLAERALNGALVARCWHVESGQVRATIELSRFISLMVQGLNPARLTSESSIGALRRRLERTDEPVTLLVDERGLLAAMPALEGPPIEPLERLTLFAAAEQLHGRVGTVAEAIARSDALAFGATLAAPEEGLIDPDPPPQRAVQWSPQVEQLWASVHEHPEDESRRAVLADALIEAQDPRGPFIALQLQRERRGELELSKEERRLLERHQTQWLQEAAPLVRKAWWRGGFIEGVVLSGAYPKPLASLALAMVTRVEFEPNVRAGFAAAWRSRLTDAVGVDVSGLEQLDERFTRLCRLSVRAPEDVHDGATTPPLHELAATPRCAALRTLELDLGLFNHTVSRPQGDYAVRTAADVEWLWRLPLTQQLSVFAMPVKLSAVGSWLQLPPDELPVPTVVLKADAIGEADQTVWLRLERGSHTIEVQARAYPPELHVGRAGLIVLRELMRGTAYERVRYMSDEPPPPSQGKSVSWEGGAGRWHRLEELPGWRPPT